jgi:hypothetical protein
MSYDDRSRGTPEQPRFEPEIIPPDRGGDRAAGTGDDGAFVFIDQHGRARRIHVGRPSPFSFLLAFVIGGFVLAGILLLAFGIVIFVVPAIAIAVAGLIAYAYARGYWRRLQGRASR